METVTGVQGALGNRRARESFAVNQQAPNRQFARSVVWRSPPVARRSTIAPHKRSAHDVRCPECLHDGVADRFGDEGVAFNIRPGLQPEARLRVMG